MGHKLHGQDRHLTKILDNQMKNNWNKEVIIIGGGPIGMACGIECAKAGIDYCILEKGCLVNSLYHYPLNMSFFSTSEKLEIGDVPFISHQYKPTRTEALEYYRRVALDWKLNIHLYEPVTHVQPLGLQYQISTPKGIYQAPYIIVSTGFYDLPNLMHIPGEDLPKVHHYYLEAHPYFGQKIAVIGASNSAVDVALETFRKGADVTMIIREDRIGENVKYWVKPDIENRIKEKSIASFFHSTLLEIHPHEILIQTPEGPTTLENDFVLAMTGYLPDFSLLGKLGVKIGQDELKTPVYNQDTMETNQPNIYLAGVICGGLKTNKWFIENSRVHAPVIIADIIRKIQLGTPRIISTKIHE
ncbi:MAG: YpdA family putative bacillithiol disulfide reductase [Chitinophagaceae bacterium]